MEAPVNKSVQTVTSIIHFAIMNVGVEAAMTAITTYVPFLKLPIINQVVRFLVEKLAGVFAREGELTAAFMIIDGQTNSQAEECREAILEFKKATESGDKDAIQAAKTKSRDAYRKLIHWDGS